MSLFFYLFTFAISLWHRKFVTKDITAAFVNNQHGIQRRGQDFHKKFVFEVYTAKRLTDEFLEKSWTKCGVNKLLKKFQSHQTLYHTTTGSFQLHPHFIEENNYTIICFNILNILLRHKYRRLTRMEEFKLVHLKCHLFAFSSISSGGLAHRETGRFPGGPLLHEVYRAPGRTREFISSIISSNWHS